MKNRNEGILDFFKKDETQTAERFFEIDRMGSKGATGLILKMLDQMTPDTNIEYKGLGREQADAVSYVQDYIKTSFLGDIDSKPTRRDNENADFAKHMDSKTWGENINFDSLLQATKELYEHIGEFFDEKLSGEETESRQATILTLGVNTVPAALLFHCLKYLNKSLAKMKKRYKNKRITKPMNEQATKPTFSKNRIALMFYVLDTNQRNNADVKTNADRALQYAPYYQILKDMHDGKTTNLSADEVKFLDTVNRTVDKMIDNGKLYKSDLKKAKNLIATTVLRENKILEDYIKTEGLFDLLTKGSADKEIDKKPKEGTACKVRGSFEVHQINAAGECVPLKKATEENFKETPFGQIVVDEINKAVAEVSEIKLALDFLNEQEDPELESQVGELGRQYATAALNRVRGEMIEKLPQMVEEILADIMTQMDSNE